MDKQPTKPTPFAHRSGINWWWEYYKTEEEARQASALHLADGRPRTEVDEVRKTIAADPGSPLSRPIPEIPAGSWAVHIHR